MSMTTKVTLVVLVMVGLWLGVVGHGASILATDINDTMTRAAQSIAVQR